MTLRLAYLGNPNSIHTRRWLRFFTRRGHRVFLLVELGQEIAPGLDERIVVRRFVSFGARFRPLGALRARRSLRRVLDEIQPDLLHAHAVTRYGWLAWVCGFRPVVTTVWGSDVFLDVHRSAVMRLLARLLLRRSVVVTGVSRALCDAAVAAGAHPQAVRVVHFGVDPERFRPGRAPDELRRRLKLEERRIVFSPRMLQPVYRQDVVLDALRRLPGDVSVVFTELAADPRTVATLKEAASLPELAGRVVFVPAIAHDDMPEFYRLADVVVSVPSSDALPVTLLEAMATGVPVVASDLPSVREILDIAPEWLVPPGDAAATADRILHALELSAADRAGLAETLRDAALRAGDETRNLLGMENTYSELVARGDPR